MGRASNPPFTAPASPVFSTFGDTAQPWSSIAAFFEDLARRNAAFADLANLASAIVQSDFPDAGLCGLTSMHDLILGPSTRILDNPHLRILYDFHAHKFRFEYEDGSREPWARTADPAEAVTVLERFLTKRARWFRQRMPSNTQP